VGDDRGRQPGGLGPEEQRVPRAVGDVGEAVGRVAGEREDPRPGQAVDEGVEGRVQADVRQVVVVQARALEVGVGEVESQRLDEVERGARAGRQPDGRSRVPRDAGLVEDDVEHVPRLSQPSRAALPHTAPLCGNFPKGSARLESAGPWAYP